MSAESEYRAWQRANEAPTVYAEDESLAQVLAEKDAEIARLTAELQRHRNANLVRAVVHGHEEWITDAINAEAFDRVPWLVAQKLADDLICECGAAKKHHHPITSDGPQCAVSPSFSHRCPCIRFVHRQDTET